MCQGLMGYFNHNLLLSIFENGLKYITVHNKLEAVASEGMFGMLLKYYCPSITSYYSNKLDDYITNKIPYLFIQKLVGRKDGTYSYSNDLVIKSSSIAHPSCLFLFKYNDKIYNSLQSALSENTLDRSILLEYYTQNTDALLLLTEPTQYTNQQHRYCIEQCPELDSIINNLRHTFYIIKYNSTKRKLYKQRIQEEIAKNGNTNYITDANLPSGHQIFAVGDSHTIFFYNSMKIKEHWGHEGKIPLTIYRLLSNNLNIYEVGSLLGNGHELYNIKEGDNVLFYYGYNDIQKNIYSHAKDRWEDEIKRIITLYIEKLISFREIYKINVIVPCIYPNPRAGAEGMNCMGSNQERQLYTTTANILLKTYCQQYGLPFLDIYDIITDAEGLLRADMTADKIHLDYNNDTIHQIIETEILRLCH